MGAYICLRVKVNLFAAIPAIQGHFIILLCQTYTYDFSCQRETPQISRGYNAKPHLKKN